MCVRICVWVLCLAGVGLGQVASRVDESYATTGTPLVSRYEYRLLATNKTSTMQKELNEAGAAGFSFVGVTVGETALGGKEVVSILRRPRAR